MSTKQEILKEIEDVSWKLMIKEPFYGHITSSINRKVVEKSSKQVESTELRSLGLSSISLNVLKELWETMTDSQKQKRFKHEVLHYIFMHPWEDAPSNKGLFYMACDISVNQYIEGGDELSFSKSNFKYLCDTYKFKIDAVNGWSSIYSSLCDMYDKVPRLIKDPDKVKEFTEKALKGEWWDEKKENLIESIFFLPKNSSGDMNSSAMNQEMQDMLNPSTGGGQASEEELKDFIAKNLEDPTDPWKEVKDGTSDLGAKSIIERSLNDAKSRGDVPGGLQSYVDMFLAPPKIDWKREVKNFTSLCGNVVSRSTMTRRSKRYKTFPSLKISRTQRLAILVDTSGSVSEDEFQAFISEMRGVLDLNCEVIFIQADAVVDSVEIYNSKLPEICRVQRSGGGGTSFDDALLYVKTRGRLEKHSHLPNIDNVDGVIYLTDGYAPAPEQESLPLGKLMWLTTQKPVDQMENEGFTGKIVLLDLED